MSELKPCQMRPERAAEKLQESYDYMTRVMPESKRSQATANLLEAISVAIATLRRSKPANEPLTLEQMREMDGEPVWIEGGRFWALVSVSGQIVYLTENSGETVYADKWMKHMGNIYRRPPERSENDG